VKTTVSRLTRGKQRVFIATVSELFDNCTIQYFREKRDIRNWPVRIYRVETGLSKMRINDCMLYERSA
jgi:hypothetical protein